MAGEDPPETGYRSRKSAGVVDGPDGEFGTGWNMAAAALDSQNRTDGRESQLIRPYKEDKRIRDCEVNSSHFFFKSPYFNFFAPAKG